MGQWDEVQKAKAFRIADEILQERARQVTDRRFDAAHDDDHPGGELAMAAALYAAPEQLFIRRDFATADAVHFMDPWPWEAQHDKRVRPHHGRPHPNRDLPYKDRRRLLVKAAALIMAEIERLDRAALSDAITASVTPPATHKDWGWVRWTPRVSRVPANEASAVESLTRTETWPLDPGQRPRLRED